jgi:hypothetical protein
MNRTASFIALFSTVVLLASVSFVSGYRNGWKSGLLSEAIPRGVLASQQLQALDGGKSENTKLQLNGQIDFGLIAANELLERPGLGWLATLSGLNLEEQQLGYIRRLAEFRSQNPSPLKYSEFGVNASSPMGADAELTEQVRSNQRALETMVERFGR